MGGVISYTIINSVVYFGCYTLSSICNACLGSTAAGTTGRKRSVLLLTLSTLLAVWFQYSLGPAIVNRNGELWKLYSWIPGLGNRIYTAWYESCASHYYKKENPQDSMYLIEQCAGNAGVYRPMAIATAFFLISAVASKIRPTLNREVWPAKFAVYFFCVAISIIMNDTPIYTGLYLWLARCGATIFVLLQQIILIDIAYNWNEDWIDRADQADRFVYGSGNNWLKAVVGTCVAFYVSSLTGIILLYKYFTECSENTWIITLTLLGIIALTTIQLTGQDGSLLTSSIISLYVTYLAYNMVSKNPNGQCNPMLGSNDVTGMVMGLTLTAVSLAWTGWSWTAEDRLNVSGVQSTRSIANSNTSAARTNATAGGINLDVPFLDPGDAPTSGLVMDAMNDTDGDDDIDNPRNGYGTEVWKLNIVMALICCFVAMTLTGWGTITDNVDDSNQYHAANPTIGRFNMAMIGISQWCAIGLYIWTLIAPRLFPDRDFS